MMTKIGRHKARIYKKKYKSLREASAKLLETSSLCFESFQGARNILKQGILSREFFFRGAREMRPNASCIFLFSGWLMFLREFFLSARSVTERHKGMKTNRIAENHNFFPLLSEKPK